MSESPRWERESHEDLSAPAPQPQDTVEIDVRLIDPTDLGEPPEFAPAATTADDEPDDAAPDETAADEAPPRFAVARQSLSGSLHATRASARDSLTATRDSLSGGADSLKESAGRIGRWVASLDRRPEFELHVRRDPIAELAPAPAAGARDGDEPDDATDHDVTARFPLARRGYDRAAVDAHVSALEAEIAELRDRPPAPMTISEEIERLGADTASILVTAHDRAHETARRAEADAARAVTDAAHDAERITAEAERRLRELDEETDGVWRERARLLDDIREVSATLRSLADEAGERFPAAEPAAAVAPEPVGVAADDD